MKRRRVFERAIFAIECAISIVGKKFVIIFVGSGIISLILFFYNVL